MVLWTLTVQLASTEGARFPVVPTQAVVPVILAVIAIPTTFHRLSHPQRRGYTTTALTVDNLSGPEHGMHLLTGKLRTSQTDSQYVLLPRSPVHGV
jgi:hypothetical protein